MRTMAIIVTLSILTCACKDFVNEAPIDTESGITAAQRKVSVDSLAKSFEGGLHLLRISSGEVSASGTLADMGL